MEQAEIQDGRKLFLVTSSYPYGDGESPFIEPEIKFLSQGWNITVLSLASRAEFKKGRAHEVNLPAGVDCIWCGNVSIVDILVGGLKMGFTRVGHEEVSRIWKSGNKRLLRLLTSIAYFGLSYASYRRVERTGAFDKATGALFYSFWFGRGAMALSLAKANGALLIFASRIHGYDLYEERAPFGRQPFQWFKRDYCDELFFVADYSKEYFAQTYGLKKSSEAILDTKVSRLGSFVPDVASSLLPSNQKKLIVSCSNCIPLKRIHLIIEAIALIDDIDVKWVHFGGGPEMQSLVELAQAKGIDYEFKGAVPNSEVNEFYANTPVDLFITTSSTEGCPVSVMEAMSFGIPIVGTAVGGIPEQIDGNGVLVDPQPRAEEIAQAIEAVLKSTKEDTVAMRRRSFEIYDEKYNLQDNLETFDEELTFLVEEAMV